MSAYSMHDIGYSSTEFEAGDGIDIKDLKLCEYWNGRPASLWAVQKIGRLQAKVEKYTYKYHHSNRFPNVDLAQQIPSYILIQFANQIFGYDGWKLDVLHLEVLECLEIPVKDENSKYDVKYTVQAEAKVKITLKDGTNTEYMCKRTATMPSKGDSYNKAKKEAVTFALKQSFLSFEKIIMDHEKKIVSNYYTDGVYASNMRNK